jgi:PadR family transcriptional regulator PadR
VLLSTEKPEYGYSLVGLLQESGIDVEQNTLYPLLRRLEQQGLMESIWDTGESRPRKYYRVTDYGPYGSFRIKRSVGSPG